MAHFEMKVRRMKTGETMIATLDSFEDALVFLRERPEFLEVVSVLSDTSAADRGRLRDAMRPYTEEEQALKNEIAAKNDAAIAENMRREMSNAQRLAEKAMRDALEADPNRPMSVRWEIEEGYSHLDPNDPREITDAVKEAIQAWVAERNTWIADRGQYVGEATVNVYPMDPPDGGERVLAGGQFAARVRDPALN
jgi:hypothetical protein